MSKDWRAHANHVVEAVARIDRILERGDPRTDEVLYDASLRNLQTLLEATSHLPPELKAQFDDIPWRKLVGMRNILVHGYLGSIDAETVVAVIENELELVRAAAVAMLHRDRQR